MLRFSLGQNWKREHVPENGPRDAFGLKLDGVDLLAGASEEPLLRVVPALVDAVHGMSHRGLRVGQLSLHDAQLELCLFRVGPHELELSVVSTGRPFKLLRTVQVELSELTEAAARCADALMRDLSAKAPKLAGSRQQQKMRSQAKALERVEQAAAPTAALDHWGYERFERAGAVGLTLRDEAARLLSWSKHSHAHLAPLLVPGAVRYSGATIEGPVALAILELARAATGEPASATLAIGNQRVPVREVFELGLELCFALRTRNVALAKNPYVESLAERCSAGLAALKVHAAPLGPAPRRRSARAKPDLPIEAKGALRRLRFALKWEKTTPAGDLPDQLQLAAQGPLVASPHAALSFSPTGELLYRRLGTHSVCATRDGRALVSAGSKVMLFTSGEPSARWVRDHDGVALGGELLSADGVLLTGLCQRGVIAFDELTGRELWRLDPPRAQRGAFTVHGHRVLLATDNGALYGLDTVDGQLRYRVRTSLPLVHAPIAMGKRGVALLSRGDRSAIFAFDLHAGTPVWTSEIPLEKPSALSLAGGRVFLAGRREGKAWALCFDSKGRMVFERQVPLAPDRLAVAPWSKSLIAQDGRGGAVCVSAAGTVDWVLGSEGAELPHLIAPVVSRGVVLIAGRVVRAVDPKSGRVLASIESGAPPAAVKADARLNVYVLDELGALKAYALSSHLAVL